MKTMKAKILYIAALFALVFTCLCPNTGKGYSRVYAAANTTSLDATDVMSDLQDADLSELTQELTEEKLYIISFTEYCFAYDANANGNFGLYIYVYNPFAKTIITNTTQNQINFGVQYEGGTATAWDKFALRCLSVSDDGKYIKFKIVDAVSKVTNETILSRLLASRLQRIYDIAEIEVCHAYGAIAESYAVGKRYVCTGFAEGYGQNAGTPSTLETYCDTSETISLDVHPTQYRLDGNNGKNIYTQDSLHSVYFTVPNEYSEKYGEMTAVHAHWLNAVIKPILVTGNQEAYNAILPYLGKDLNEVNASHEAGRWGGETVGFRLDSRVVTLSTNDKNRFDYNLPTKSNVNPLYIMFNAGAGLDSADGFIPPAEGEGSLTQKMEQASAQFGGELVEERYSRVLFESVDTEFTHVRFKDTDELKIKNVGIDKREWWELFQGWDKVDEATLDRFENVKAIETVTEEMVVGSKVDVCERLKIGEQDYDAFINYYKENKENGTVYLFRYKVTDCISQELTVYRYNEEGRDLPKNPMFPTWYPGNSIKFYWDVIDTNAYFFQEECDIGFDIIDITLTNEQGEHVLGVAAKPIDVFPTPTPPLDTTTDETPWGELLFWVKMIVGIIVVVVLLPLAIFILSTVFPAFGVVVKAIFKGLWTLLVWIVKGVIWLVCLPFEGIAALVRKIRGKHE